jgi:predicted metal-binding protein
MISITDRQHNLFVCTTCASVWQDGQRIGESGGELLLQKLQRMANNWQLRHQFPIRGVGCMSACSRSCAIAFVAAGKPTYLFGDLPINESAAAILECAEQYYAKEDGVLPWSERPEPLKKGVLAKIPPHT